MSAVALPQDAQARLACAARALAVSLNAVQGAQLLSFIAHMQRWNRTYNLTALRDPAQMLVQHVFDSLAVLAPLAQKLSPISTPNILDVGSGGGLPGVVLAIARPDWQVLCVDAVEKKIAFVRQMAGVLRLPNLRAQHARIETLPGQACDVVISRAFASLADFATLAGHHAKAGAALAAMKGQRPEAEMQALHGAAWQVAEFEDLHVPELPAQRCLLWLRRTQDHTQDCPQARTQN